MFGFLILPRSENGSHDFEFGCSCENEVCEEREVSNEDE